MNTDISLDAIESFNLTSGSHCTPTEGTCLMEAVAYIAGELHSDAPRCACPVLTKFGVSFNDGLRSDEERNRLLRPMVHRLVGTRCCDAHSEQRSWMALDWIVRTHATAWLDLVGLSYHAERLRVLPELTRETIKQAREPMAAARAAAWEVAEDAGWDAARAVARDAGWEAAGSAAREAAWDAAEDAARDAAGSAARSAAWEAAGSAAGAAAWNAAWAAAGGAAGDAARGAAGDAARAAARDAAGSAARSAAWTSLESTVIALQASAVDLFDRMILVGVDEHGARCIPTAFAQRVVA